MAESIPQKKRLMVFGEGSENGEKENCLTPLSEEEERQNGLSGTWKKEPLLAVPATEKAARFDVGSENWEKEYSYEEKRLKSLVDEEGYEKWEKENRLWEIQNHLVPLAEEVSYEEEKRQKDLEAKKQRQKEILLVLSSLSLEDEKKGEEAYRKRLEELRTKPLIEEEKPLKELYLENMEKARLGLEGWDLAYYSDKRSDRSSQPVELVPLDERPKRKIPLSLVQYLFKKRQPAERCSTVSTNREEKREKHAAEGRCLDGSYLTPYCKCDTQCCGFNTDLGEIPSETTPIWLAYCHQRRQSHCFDIDDYPGWRFGTGVGPLAPSQDFNGKAELLMKLANRAIQEYNERECNVFKYKVLKIEKVNFSAAMYFTYWMTVKVLNLTLGTPIETFQIHAGISYVNDDEVIFCCRPKEEAIIGLPSCEFCFGLLPERCVTGEKEP